MIWAILVPLLALSFFLTVVTIRKSYEEPELKSNELVKQQLDLYIQNNQEIKKLKLEKLNKYKYELWLFFDFKAG